MILRVFAEDTFSVQVFLCFFLLVYISRDVCSQSEER